MIKGEECEMIFSFQNPLDEELTECQLSIDGSGLMKPKVIDISEWVLFFVYITQVSYPSFNVS